MKKLMTLSTIFALSFSILNGFTASASTPISASTSQAQENSSRYIKLTGVIKEIDKKDEKKRTVIVEGENKSETHLTLSHETLLLSAKATEGLQEPSLEKGDHIEAYYDKNKPMILIYPAQITPEIIIAHHEGNQVKVSKFDDQWISDDHQLQLNITEQTVILDQQGDIIQKEDLNGKELIVFYTVSTRSIPAQTIPHKVIALNDRIKELPKEINEIIAQDRYTVDGTTMIPLRKVVEHFGYEVEWKPETYSIILSKQNSSFQITIGENRYAYNRSLQYFDIAPEIKDGKTYVPEGFLQPLL